MQWTRGLVIRFAIQGGEHCLYQGAAQSALGHAEDVQSNHRHRNHQSPGRTVQSPYRNHQSPGRAIQSPHRNHQSPGRAIQSPYRNHQSPGPTIQSPHRNHQSPGRTVQSPHRDHQSPVLFHTRSSHTARPHTFRPLRTWQPAHSAPGNQHMWPR